MTREDRLRTAIALVPLTPAAELLLPRLKERRKELDGHNPGALLIAAVALAAGHEAAWRKVPAIRADRQERYREMQMQGERALPVEDLAAIGQEGEAGRDVLRDILRVLAASIGERLESIGRDEKSLPRAAADAGRSVAHLLAEIQEATADGVLTAVERQLLRHLFEDALKQLTALDGPLTNASAR